MKQYFIYFALLLCGSLLSCSSSDKAPVIPPIVTELTASPLQLMFDAEPSESQSVIVTTNIEDWTFSLDGNYDWITTNQEKGKVTVSVSSNSSDNSRIAILTIKAKEMSSEIAIIQKSAQGAITDLIVVLRPTELLFEYDGLDAQQVSIVATEGAELNVKPVEGWEGIISEDRKSLEIRPTKINTSTEAINATLILTASKDGKSTSATVALTQKANENSKGFVVAPRTIYFDYDQTSSKDIMLAFNKGTTWEWELVPIKNENDGEWNIVRVDETTLRISPQAVNQMYKTLRAKIIFTAEVPGKGTVGEEATIIQAGFPPLLEELTGYYRAYGVPAFVNPSAEVNWSFYFTKTKAKDGTAILISDVFGKEKDQTAGSQIAIECPRGGIPVIYPHVTGTKDGYNLVPMGAELNKTTKTIKLLNRCEGIWVGDDLTFYFTRSEGDIEVVVGVFLIDPSTGEYKGQVTELYSALRLNLVFIIPSSGSSSMGVPEFTGERVKVSTKETKFIPHRSN